MFLRRLLGWLIEHWKTEDKITTEPDVIVSLTYGTLPTCLVDATELSTYKAIELAHQYPKAMIAFATADNCFAGSGSRELVHRWHLMSSRGISEMRVCYGGRINNSIEEAELIRAKLIGYETPPQHILLVSGAMHSRRVRLIWKRTFPDVDIRVVTIDRWAECQADHPLRVSRSHWRFFLMNVAHYLILRLPSGFAFSRRLIHRQAKH